MMHHRCYKIYACIEKMALIISVRMPIRAIAAPPHLLLCFQLEVVVVENVGPTQGSHGCARRQRQPSSPAPRLAALIPRVFLLLSSYIALLCEISTPGRG